MAGRDRSRRRSLLLALAGSALVSLALVGVVSLVDGGDDGEAGGEPRPPRACTLIACSPGVRVTLRRVPPPVERGRVCVAGECGEASCPPTCFGADLSLDAGAGSAVE